MLLHYMTEVQKYNSEYTYYYFLVLAYIVLKFIIGATYFSNLIINFRIV